MLELRVLTPDDWAIWRHLRLAALEEAPHAFGSRLVDWQGDGDREERWRGRLSIPGSHNVVAFIDGEPVGMASGVPDEYGDDEVVELISMWVSPRARGRGVADLLVRAVVEWGLQRSARVVKLAVAEGNDAARVAYERNGFAPTGESAVMPDGVRIEQIMSRSITPPS